MTIIKATCPTCGEVDLTAEQVELRMVPSGGGTYGFECPVCVVWVSKPADARVVQLLISGGVRPEILDVPEAETASAHQVQLPPFTYDDLLDFHEMLQSELTVESFLGSRR